MVRSILTRCSGTFSLQVNDVQEMLECLSVEEEGMWSCIGSSGHTSSGVAGGLVDDDIEEHGHSAPMSFGRRGM
jgi:hypothetical protein